MNPQNSFRKYHFYFRNESDRRSVAAAEGDPPRVGQRPRRLRLWADPAGQHRLLRGHADEGVAGGEHTGADRMAAEEAGKLKMSPRGRFRSMFL